MQHIDMACSAALLAMQQSTATGAGAQSGMGQRFAELVNQQCSGNAPDLYVASKLSAAGGAQSHPILDALSSIQKMNIGTPAKPDSYQPNDVPVSSTDTNPANDRESGEAQTLGDEVLSVQAELIKTAIMFETVNATRQGTATLFQLQG
jgi:hypothetical protein